MVDCYIKDCCTGSPSGTQPIRSRLVDDSPPVISPPGGPPGLNMRRAAMEGPPGSGEWHPGSEGWRRAGGPQEWRGPAGPMGEEDEALSPRRHGSARVSQVCKPLHCLHCSPESAKSTPVGVLLGFVGG